MPELPEVETVVRTLRGPILNQTISKVILHRQDIIQPATADLVTFLTGRRIVDLTRRAKRIVFTLDDGNRFYIHLGMSGQLRLESPDAPERPHTHAIFLLSPSGRALRFRDPRRFGGIFVLSPDESPDAGLGPEPLTLRPAAFYARLSKSHRPLKSALLDQRLIAGLGNIYADEALHLSGLHPLRHGATLSIKESAALLKNIKLTLRRAIRHKGSSLRDYVDVNGESGRYQNRHSVYGREGKACRQCGKAIQRIVLSGRSTHFCAKCQARQKKKRS